MSDISRRSLVTAAGALGAAALARNTQAAEGLSSSADAHVMAQAAPAAPAVAPPSQPISYLFFNKDEAAFLEAAVDRLIPADDRWPGAREAGVTNYIDKQMAGAWGAGERLYRSGPWQPGTPSQGYQLPLTPAELFRTAISAIDKELRAKGKRFADMTAAEQDAFLTDLQNSNRDLGGVPANAFFAELWQSTQEGFFADPVYGGNRDMVAWRMIGFPGAYASYYDLVDKHGMKLDRPPMSLAQDVSGHVHVDPNIAPKIP